MESNRDEAERCIAIAAAAIKASQTEKARRFLEKAQRLYPSQRVRGEQDWGEAWSGWGPCGLADLSPALRLRMTCGDAGHHGTWSP